MRYPPAAEDMGVQYYDLRSGLAYPRQRHALNVTRIAQGK